MTINRGGVSLKKKKMWRMGGRSSFKNEHTENCIRNQKIRFSDKLINIYIEILYVFKQQKKTEKKKKDILLYRFVND